MQLFQLNMMMAIIGMCTRITTSRIAVRHAMTVHVHSTKSLQSRTNKYKKKLKKKMGKNVLIEMIINNEGEVGDKNR